MNYKNDPVATNKELERIRNYLHAKGVFATNAMVVAAALAITKRLGAGDYTFYSELK